MPTPLKRTFRDLLRIPARIAAGNTELLISIDHDYNHLRWANGEPVVNPYPEHGTVAELFRVRNVWQRVGLYLLADVGGYRHGARWFYVTLDGTPVFFGVQGEEGKRGEYSHLYFPLTTGESDTAKLYRDLCGVVSATPARLEPWLPGDFDPRSSTVVSWEDELPADFLCTPLHDGQSEYGHADLTLPDTLFVTESELLPVIPFSMPPLGAPLDDVWWLSRDVEGCDAVLACCPEGHPLHAPYAYRKTLHTRALHKAKRDAAERNVMACEKRLREAREELAKLSPPETPTGVAFLRADIASIVEFLDWLPVSRIVERRGFERRLQAQRRKLLGCLEAKLKEHEARQTVLEDALRETGPSANPEELQACMMVTLILREEIEGLHAALAEVLT